MSTREQPIAEIDHFTYQALRRYWTKYDIAQGRGFPYVWDLRIRAVNRWPDGFDIQQPGPRHIHYTLLFDRTDMTSSEEYAHVSKHGQWPGPPTSWVVVWSEGTFLGDPNPEYAEWEQRLRPLLRESEEEFDRWVANNPAPPQLLPSPENWSPDQAREDLEQIIPEAQRQLVEEDPQGMTWEELHFPFEPPDDPTMGARLKKKRKGPFGREVMIGL